MEPGIYPNLSREEYDAIDAVNQTLLKLVDRSLAHAKAYIDGYRKQSDSLAWAAAYHVFVLEADRFSRQYQIVPKMRRSGKDWDALVADHGRDRILWEEDVETFKAMRDALAAAKPRRELLRMPGQYETSIVWRRGETLCKARIDKYMPDIDAALDLKKTQDARERAFVGSVCDYGYDIQAAFIMDGLHALTGKPHGFVFLAQEDEPPYESAMYTVEWGGETHRVGQSLYGSLMGQLEYARRTGDWRGYSHTPSEIVLPKWRKESVIL